MTNNRDTSALMYSFLSTDNLSLTHTEADDLTTPHWRLLTHSKVTTAELQGLLEQGLSGSWMLSELTPCGDCCGWRLVAVDQHCQLDRTVFTQSTLAVELLAWNGSFPSLSKPGLLLMDMDSTAITIECIDELAALAGVGASVAEVTASAMRGELDFEQSLRARVAKLANSDAGFIAQLCQQLPLMPGIEAMVARLQLHGWKLAVVSGGFMPFVEQLMQQVGLDDAMANQLDIADGKIIGTVSGTIVDSEYKAQRLAFLANEWGIPASQTVAIGDGANDINMINYAALGIAYHAKPALKNAANACVDKLGLDSLALILEP
ncbi:phosphoserine phosphatase SerB [Paraferrimonas haliotis]|uniref:Phosphoserine phosphatase n=1 Tax=Paraferrimonas haliotis TaxID=2013866 RepID=A0AA37TZS2_9GAMM|nr:phosphoserine phosphatase SerB [Paraferrimonas haliotis]GLS83839.1 hypothetical protein GCM10007894_18160 [Paraferrimonas haliotis]GLS83966.1 hypothetical protein GCM10007894_19430 [Paraferrimonas haliotis]